MKIKIKKNRTGEFYATIQHSKNGKTIWKLSESNVKKSTVMNAVKLLSEPHTIEDETKKAKKGFPYGHH